MLETLQARLRNVAIHQSTSLKRISILFLYLALFIAFFAVKWTYPIIDAAVAFPDTRSYAITAEQPVTSLSFWAGIRPITVPMFYKLLDVNAENYQQSEKLKLIAETQIWISMVCWTVLGLSISRKMCSRILGVLAFGTILAFSLIYDISRWDVQPLSESLSFSFLVLMLAGWIWLLSPKGAGHNRLIRFALLIGLIVVTFLYSFARDSNPYFVLIAAAAFFIASLFKKLEISKPYILAYFGMAIILVVAQNVSVNVGDRWQVFIVNHLIMRILPDPQSLDFFEKSGLPVTDAMIQGSSLGKSEFRIFLLTDPAMAPIRQWIMDYGKATYINYLVKNLSVTLFRPLGRAKSMLDGTGQIMGYRGDQSLPLSNEIQGISNIFFPILPLWTYALAYLVMAGWTVWILARGSTSVLAMILAALLITIYPLLLFIWHGDPFEIERHAEQIAIQSRLAVWLALLLLLDQGVLRLRRMGRPA